MISSKGRRGVDSVYVRSARARGEEEVDVRFLVTQGACVGIAPSDAIFNAKEAIIF